MLYGDLSCVAVSPVTDRLIARVFELMVTGVRLRCSGDKALLASDYVGSIPRPNLRTG